jgi:hypothetical protein
MAFTVELRDEQGAVLERSWQRSFEVGAAMPSYTSIAYPYLRLVDPYSNTWFSSYQMVAVIPELERLATEKPAPALDKVIEMASRCQATMGSCLVFIGD